MNFLEKLAPSPSVGWLTVVVMVQITVVALFAAVVARSILKRRAAARHGLWLCALVCVLVGPVVAILADRVGVAWAIIPWTQGTASSAGTSVHPGVDSNRAVTDLFEEHWPAASSLERQLIEDGDYPAESAVRSDRLSSGTIIASNRHSGGGPEAATERRLPHSTSLTLKEERLKMFRALFGALVLTWAIGVVIGMARLIRGWRQLGRLSRSLEAFEVGDHGDAVSEVRHALGLFTMPPVYTSRAISGPAAIGVRRACVVLPETLASTLSPRQLRDVLVHECAHIVRRDPLICLLQRLVGVLYWPHPLVHHLNVHLARSREELCDNFVIRSGDPYDYARTLLELSELFRPNKAADVGLGLTDNRWTLHDRVAGLLDPRRDAMTKAKPWSMGALALTLATICVAIGVIRPIRLNAAGTESLRETASSNAPERVARGIVVDQKGQPVANATVRTVQREKTSEPATTAADGSFKLVIGGFMLVEENLVGAAVDGLRMGLGTYTFSQQPDPAQPIRIVLKPSRATTVHVRDSKDQLIKGAMVAAIGYDYHCAATTDAGGAAVLRVPIDAEMRYVLGVKAGVGFDYFENYRSRPATEIAPLPSDVTVRLDGARTVHIRAVDTAGRPISGVEFCPWYIRKTDKLDSANIDGLEFLRARTDDRGMVAFDWLPSNVEEGVPFLVFPGEWSCPSPPEYRSTAGGWKLEARVLRSTKIRGVVRRLDGRPAAGILIRAEGRGATNHYCRVHTRTDNDGSYSLNVYPDQSYIIAVLDERWAARSLSGVIVREGKTLEGLDLTLGEGTLVHGRVTKGAEGQPAVNETITLIQQGQSLQAEFVFHMGGATEEDMPLWAKSNVDGTYQLRVGPGRYKVLSPNHEGQEQLTIETQPEIVRDFRMTESSRWESLSGVAIEKTPAGERSIAGALVEASPIGRGGRESQASADAQGRFQLSIEPGQAMVIYTRDPKGTIAGFTPIAANSKDVRTYAAPASHISGSVLDSRGQPAPGRRVRLLLHSGPRAQASARFFRQSRTDAAGRYEFTGVVVGARAEVSVPSEEDAFSSTKGERLDVRSPDPVTMPDITIPKPKEKAANQLPRVDGSPRAR